MLDVVTIGSATLDIFLKSDQFTIDKHDKGVYLCGKYEGKIEAQELVMTSGGGATNSAVSFSRKGFMAGLVVEMGKDPAAAIILAELKREGLDLSFVVQEENETTAVSTILLSSKGGNSIVTYRGASRMLTAGDIPFDKLGMILKPGGWVYLTSVGGDMELVEKVLSWAKEKSRKVFWNPGESEIRNIQHSTFPARSGYAAPARIAYGKAVAGGGVAGGNIQHFSPDVLQLNRQEATDFFGVNFTDDNVWKAEHCPTSSKTLLIITDGASGGRVCLPAKKSAMSRVRIEPKGEWQAKVGHHGECIWYKGIKTKMVDSTGAGDAFGSGVVAGLIGGKDIKESIEWGKKQAASVVSYFGAKKGLLEISRF